MSSIGYHEPEDLLSEETKDMHRAIVSLMEELEAIDWYQQRVDASKDEELRAILVHNKNEEIEHAMMVLEWIRRKSEKFGQNVARYLGSSGPIAELEDAVTGPSEDDDAAGQHALGDGSLGIGSLKE